MTRRSGKGSELWFGRMVAFVDTSTSPERRKPENLWAFVRWCETASGTAASRLLGMVRLRWCYQAWLAPGAAE